MDWMLYVKPAAVFVSVIVIGYIVRKILFAYLVKITKKTDTNIDDIVIDALRNPFILWFIIFGISMSIKTTSLDAKAVGIADKILISLWIISFTLVAAKIVSGVINDYISGKEGAPKMSSLTQNAARWVILAIGFLILLNKLGISIAPILTALGVGGLAVALALQETLSNLFAGFHITISKQIQVGDYIKIDSGQEGYVVDIGWRNIRIKELSNNMIMLSNTKLSQAIVTNYYMPERGIYFTVPVGVDYSSDLDKVEKITIEVAREVLKNVPGGDKNHEPSLRYNAFADSSINFSVVLRAAEFTDKFLIVHEFIKSIKRRYDKEGIVIPFPSRTLHIQK
jgi:small-conductance mechanosensitive channel